VLIEKKNYKHLCFTLILNFHCFNFLESISNETSAKIPANSFLRNVRNLKEFPIQIR
jgi:hypothetical protein